MAFFNIVCVNPWFFQRHFKKVKYIFTKNEEFNDSTFHQYTILSAFHLTYFQLFAFVINQLRKEMTTFLTEEKDGNSHLIKAENSKENM